MFDRFRNVRDVEPDEVISPAAQTPYLSRALAEPLHTMQLADDESPPDVEAVSEPAEAALHTVQLAEDESPPDVDAVSEPAEAPVVAEEPVAAVSAPTRAPESEAQPSTRRRPSQRSRARRKRRAARREEDEKILHARVDAAEEDELAVETSCEIRFWRGYRKGKFYACVFADGAEVLAIAESPAFRAHGNGTPEKTDEAAGAYDALRGLLEEAGWEHVSSGTTWFDDVFRAPTQGR